MINLKKLLKGDKSLVALNKEEVDVLTYVLCHRNDFEAWFSQQAHRYPNIRFVFYYPSAIDLCYDHFKLFTVYFSKNAADQIAFNQMKISRLNSDSLNSANWNPFKDVILDYLTMAQERNTDLQFRKYKSLHDYQQLCKSTLASTEKENPIAAFTMASAQMNS